MYKGTRPEVYSSSSGISYSVRKSVSQGVILGHPGVILGHPEVILGHPGVILGHPGVILGHQGVILGHPEVILGHPGVILGHPGVALGHPGITLAVDLDKGQILKGRDFISLIWKQFNFRRFFLLRKWCKGIFKGIVKKKYYQWDFLRNITV